MRDRIPPTRTEPRPAVPPPGPRTVRLPNAPVLVAGIGQAAWISPAGEIARVAHEQAAAWVRSRPPILRHGQARPQFRQWRTRPEARPSAIRAACAAPSAGSSVSAMR